MVRSLPTLPLSGHCPPGVLPERNSNLPAWTELTKLAAGAWSAGNVMFNCFSRASAPMPCALAVLAAVRTKTATPAMLNTVLMLSLLVATDRPMQNQCRRVVAAPCAARYDRATTGLRPSAVRDALPMAISAGFSGAAVVFACARRLSGIAQRVRPQIGFVDVQASSRHPPPR